MQKMTTIIWSCYRKVMGDIIYCLHAFKKHISITTKFPVHYCYQLTHSAFPGLPASTSNFWNGEKSSFFFFLTRFHSKSWKFPFRKIGNKFDIRLFVAPYPVIQILENAEILVIFFFSDKKCHAKYLHSCQSCSFKNQIYILWTIFFSW